MFTAVHRRHLLTDYENAQAIRYAVS